ncbi:hypothetical protein DFH08DRAFT_827175 [Mycena albidolilacea]|uniref:Uncharacterized protein n=1 Tax=Mycena albidolilacea TaxID=1033008 RepID=A0AAD6YYX4_9AGAR|nr:hypothetical protein DFH08DRAFT_827175 [Mycena albidolilacea]
MRRGRKPLDPEVQAERRRESRLRYESQHREERREAARLRMQRHREVIRNSGYKVIESYKRQARRSAAKYRESHSFHSFFRQKCGTSSKGSKKLSAPAGRPINLVLDHPGQETTVLMKATQEMTGLMSIATLTGRSGTSSTPCKRRFCHVGFLAAQKTLAPVAHVFAVPLTSGLSTGEDIIGRLHEGRFLARVIVSNS